MRLSLFSLLLSLAAAEYYRGTVNTVTGYQFLGKFVFDQNPEGEKHAGYVETSLKALIPVAGTEYDGVELWLYSDEDFSWPAVYYNQTLTCQQVREKAKNYNDKTGAVDALFKWRYDAATNKFLTESTGQEVAKAVISQGARRRYWFMAIGRCTGPTPVLSGIEFETHWVNEFRSGWNQEFGANQAGLQTLFVFAFLLYLPFTCVHFYGVLNLSKKLEYVHPMVKVFALVILLQFVVVLTKLCYWGAFVSNGVGLPGALVASDIVDMVCRSIFILILMLMAKGWTISGDELTGKFFVMAIVAAYALLDGLAIMWKTLVDDPAATSMTGGVKFISFVTLGVWFIFAVWFVFTIFASYKREDNPVKKGLYRNLALVYIPWFFGLPIVTLLAAYVLNAWSAQRILEGVTLLVSTVAYLVLSFLLWPSRAEEYFNISTPDVMRAQIDTYEQL